MRFRQKTIRKGKKDISMLIMDIKWISLTCWARFSFLSFLLIGFTNHSAKILQNKAYIMKEKNFT